MGLTDIFRPKWKHSDAATRMAAVRELAADAAELTTVAREDRDPGVRRVALKRIADPALLLELAAAESEASLSELARERASSLLVADAVGSDEGASQAALARIDDEAALVAVAQGAVLEAARRAALERLNSPRAIAEVARGAKLPAARLDALQRVDDPLVLRGIAINDEAREVGLAALERVDEPEALAQIAQKSKQRAVRRRAQQRVASAAPGDAEAAADTLSVQKLRARQLELCREVEQLVPGPDRAALVHAVDDAQVAMRELEAEGGDALDANLLQRFRRACTGVLDRPDAPAGAQPVEAPAEPQEAPAATAPAADDGRQALVAICEQVEQLEAEAADPQRVTRLAERFAALPGAERLQRRFDRAREAAERRHRQHSADRELVDEATRLCERAEQLAREPQLDRARRAFKGVEQRLKRLPQHRLGDALQQRLQQAAETLEQRQAEADARRAAQIEKNAQRLEKLCRRLEQAPAGLKQAERLLKEVSDALRKLGPLPSREQAQQLRAELSQGKQQLYAKVQELREAEQWKRWSNVPKRQALCEQAEGLVALEDRKQAAERLRQIQAEWKRTGPVTRDKSDALWERFRTACDKVREHCASYFAELDAKREENLHSKERLCEEVEALAASSDTLGDLAAWEATANKIKGLQGEWKKVGPVPRKQSDAVWRRFRAACDRFFEARQAQHEQLDTERQENLGRKEQLCEQVEALAESTDWEATASKIKGLQGEWKKVGPVPRKQSDAIWRRFRAACDRFFEARQAHFDAERQGNVAQREAICAEIEALGTEETDREGLADKVQQLREGFDAAGAVPRDAQRPLQRRLQAALARVVLAHPEAFKDSDLDPAMHGRRMERLCQRAEELAGPEDEPAVAAEQASSGVEQMAARLRTALAENVFRGAEGEDQFKREADEIRRLQSAWDKVGPVDPTLAEELSPRFQRACQRVLERARR